VIEVSYSKIKNKKKFEGLFKKAQVVNQKSAFVKLRLNTQKHDCGDFMEEVMDAVSVYDLQVENPSLDHIIRKIYVKGRVK